jgi:hypothetical protein
VLRFAGLTFPIEFLCHWGCSFLRLTSTDVTSAFGAIFRQPVPHRPCMFRIRRCQRPLSTTRPPTLHEIRLLLHDSLRSEAASWRCISVSQVQAQGIGAAWAPLEGCEAGPSSFSLMDATDRHARTGAQEVYLVQASGFDQR